MILSIDQGTTGSRVVIYDKNARRAASAYQEIRQYFPFPGWVEHRPEDLWQSVNNSIQKVLKKISPAKIQAIGITNQRETTIIWDKISGRPVYNAIVWQCRRTSDRCDELKRIKGRKEFFRQRTGLPIDGYFSASKIEWILKNVSGARRKAEKGDLLFGTVDSWILWKLTAGKAHRTDYTNAARTMLFNIEKLEWDKDILKIFNIPEQMLPDVRKSVGIFGASVKTGSLPAGIPISGVAGDQQAALFGQLCFEAGEVKNTYGTGCFILMNTGRARPASKYGLITTLAVDAAGAPCYALEGAVFSAGSAVQWLRDGLKILKACVDSQKLARAAEDNQGIYFVPAFTGLGAPYWDADARGAILGITRGAGREHIARAVLEAICYQVKDVLEAMRKDSGIKIKNLKVDGGAAKNSFILKFQADILGIKVFRFADIEVTSRGAAYLAGLAVGFWQGVGELRRFSKIDKIFKSTMPACRARILYNGWLSAVRRVLSGA